MLRGMQMAPNDDENATRLRTCVGVIMKIFDGLLI